MVVQELDIAGHEIHVQPQVRVGRQVRQHGQSLKIGVGQPPSLREALRRSYMQPRIQHRDQAFMGVEYRCVVERRLARRHLAAAVHRERLVQPLQQVGPSLCHDIVDGHRTDDR